MVKHILRDYTRKLCSDNIKIYILIYNLNEHGDRGANKSRMTSLSRKRIYITLQMTIDLTQYGYNAIPY